MARLKVLFAVSECVPLVKIGGLGDVAGALPVALRRRGHDVRVLIPRYRCTKGFAAEKLPRALAVPGLDGVRGAAIYQTEISGGVPVYLLEHDALYDRDGVYGDSGGDFIDNVLRYSFLSRAVLEQHAVTSFEPDVLHVHDWQTSLVPVFQKALGRTDLTSVLTIHNLGYQGRCAPDLVPQTGLSWEQFHELGLEYFGALNLLKGGLHWATLLSAVSPTYAIEVQTSGGGFGLDGVLRQRRDDLIGILNGIDEDVWDPATDPHLPATYSSYDLSGKAVCKAALQREMGLPEEPDVPLIGMIARFVEQKGIDIFADALSRLLPLDLQFAVIGSGFEWAESLFSRLSATTSNFRAHIGHSERLAHLVEAGSDLYVMPSRYEPCGLNQMYSQRYGTLPIVRAVGGLEDTVEHEVTGFKFRELSGEVLARTVAWAADSYRSRKDHFLGMQLASMNKPMGWDRAAAQYDALYRLALSRRESDGPEKITPG